MQLLTNIYLILSLCLYQQSAQGFNFISAPYSSSSLEHKSIILPTPRSYQSSFLLLHCLFHLNMLSNLHHSQSFFFTTLYLSLLLFSPDSFYYPLTQFINRSLEPIYTLLYHYSCTLLYILIVMRGSLRCSANGALSLWVPYSNKASTRMSTGISIRISTRMLHQKDISRLN